MCHIPLKGGKEKKLTVILEFAVLSLSLPLEKLSISITKLSADLSVETENFSAPIISCNP